MYQYTYYNHLLMLFSMHLAIDIDDTLCYTTERRMSVFQERFGNPEWLTPAQLTEKYEIVQRVPYRQTPQAQALIEELITQDENRTDLGVIPDALSALYELEKHTSIVYLTSRQEEHRKKTLERLQKNNFPNCQLVMRPNETSEAIDAYGQFTRKARYLSLEKDQYSCIIDNSISLSEQLAHLHHPVQQILFWHVPQKKSNAPHRLQYWKDWKSILPLLS